MPELVMTADGSQLTGACFSKVFRALVKVMDWLGASREARQQLWRRLRQWLPLDHVRECFVATSESMHAFQRACAMLQDAVASGERENVVAVLCNEWGVSELL